MISPQAFAKLADDLLFHFLTHPDLLQRLMDESGLSPDDLRASAGDPGFAVALLDFVCAEDARLVACAEAVGWTPVKLMQLHQAVEAGALG